MSLIGAAGSDGSRHSSVHHSSWFVWPKAAQTGRDGLRLPVLEARRHAVEQVEVALERAGRILARVVLALLRPRERALPDVAEVEHGLAVRQDRVGDREYFQFLNWPRSQRLSPVECSHASRKCTSHGAEKIQYSMPS